MSSIGSLVGAIPQSKANKKAGKAFNQAANTNRTLQTNAFNNIRNQFSGLGDFGDASNEVLAFELGLTDQAPSLGQQTRFEIIDEDGNRVGDTFGTGRDAQGNLSQLRKKFAFDSKNAGIDPEKAYNDVLAGAANPERFQAAAEAARDRAIAARENAAGADPSGFKVREFTSQEGTPYERSGFFTDYFEDPSTGNYIFSDLEGAFPNLVAADGSFGGGVSYEDSEVGQALGALGDPYELTNDFKFRRDEGLKAIERGAVGRAGLNSGATQKALIRFADDNASLGREQNELRRERVREQHEQRRERDRNTFLGLQAQEQQDFLNRNERSRGQLISALTGQQGVGFNAQSNIANANANFANLSSGINSDQANATANQAIRGGEIASGAIQDGFNAIFDIASFAGGGFGGGSSFGAGGGFNGSNPFAGSAPVGFQSGGSFPNTSSFFL